jgi:murein DD-endopeptidase MepM/ murein hydrolase activator NlpD
VLLLILGVFVFSSGAQSNIGGTSAYLNQKDCPSPYSEVGSNEILSWPFDYIHFNQYFSSYHPAVDLYATSREPIKSVGYGFVTFAGYSPDGYGNYVIINHPEGYQTLYGHMVEIPKVRVGDYVFPGKILGLAGSTGHSTGVHLHFEIIKNGCYLDPKTVLGNK